MGYVNTFISIAPDSAATAGVAPKVRNGVNTRATIEYELLAPRPYWLTQEDLELAARVRRTRPTGAGVDDSSAQPMACLRTSPLARIYGWGFHFDAGGKVALVAVGSPEYQRFAADPDIRQLAALRRKRAV